MYSITNEKIFIRLTYEKASFSEKYSDTQSKIYDVVPLVVRASGYSYCVSVWIEDPTLEQTTYSWLWENHCEVMFSQILRNCLDTLFMAVAMLSLTMNWNRLNSRGKFIGIMNATYFLPMKVRLVASVPCQGNWLVTLLNFGGSKFPRSMVGIWNFMYVTMNPKLKRIEELICVLHNLRSIWDFLNWILQLNLCRNRLQQLSKLSLLLGKMFHWQCQWHFL